MSATDSPLRRKLSTLAVRARHTKTENVQPISVSIRVIRGRNLASRDANGLSDPFAVVSYGVTTAKTRVIKKTLFPEWNEVVKLGSYLPDQQVVHVAVWDWDYMCPRNDFIGQFDVDLSRPEFQACLASKQESPETWFRLEPRPNKNDGPVTGDVCCAVTLVQNASPCCGYLSKKGGVRRNWKRRWFVLHCEENPVTRLSAWSMVYYASQKDFEKAAKPLGAIPLTGASLEAGFDESQPLSVGGGPTTSAAAAAAASSSSSGGDKEAHFFVIHTVETKSASEQHDAPPSTSSSSSSSHAIAQLKSLEESAASRAFELRADSRDEYFNWVRQLEPLLPPHFLNSQTGVKSRSRLAPIFGESLADVMERQRADGFAEPLPVYVADVIARIRKNTATQGIFRIAGPRADIDALIDTANAGKPVDWSAVTNVHTATGFFKEWLRELSEPLLTYELYADWVAAADTPALAATADDATADDASPALAAYQALLARLPRDNLVLLKEVVSLCVAIVAQEDVNLMSSKNVAIVMSPNLLWDRSKNLELAFSHLTSLTNLCRDLIDNYAELFEAPAAPARPPRPALRRRMTNNRCMKTVDEARRLFAAYDYDGNGTLDQKEFWAFFSDVCQSSTTPEVAARLREIGVVQAIRLIDVNGDGEIDQKEFLDFWQRLLEGKLLPRSTYQFR